MALLVVLGVGVGAYAAFAASPPPAPSITAPPGNPTNSQSASFTYSDSASIQKFQCSLDGSAFADCGTTNPATKTPAYSGLAAGSHTFQVRAVASGGTSTATPFSWTVDLTPPKVLSINRVGVSPTNAATVQWTVTFSEDVNGVDGTDFALVRTGAVSGGSIGTITPSSGPASVYTVTATTGSGDGTLGLNLVDNDSITDKATNPLGGVGTTGSNNGSFTGLAYTIDKTGPASAPAITAGPVAGSSVASTSASFSFSSSGSDVAGFRCQLDAAAAASCTSPQAYSGLAQGSRTFAVWAVDALGNAGPAASRSWTVDTVAPVAPSITVKPVNPSNQTATSFSFTGEVGASFLCKLDGASFAACSSPQPTSGLLAGSHTFQVEAKDAAGNVGAAASYTWTVDLTPPTIAVSFPTNGGTYSASGWNTGCAGSAAICGSASDPSGVTGGVVSILQISSGKYWSGSSFNSASEFFNSASLTAVSGTTYSGYYPLALPPDGAYTVHVRATDGAGNTTPAFSQTTVGFTIDTTPPVAPTINSGPTTPLSSHDATFAFSEPSEPSATFLCKLDTGSYTACASPKSYGSLVDGAHAFLVEAVDAVGNVSVPKSYSWMVDTTPPPAPTIGTPRPANPTNQTAASFTFSDTESGVTFLCKLDTEPGFTACTSAKSYTGLPAGSRTFQVEAKDAAGNVGSPAAYTWVIDLTAPAVPTITAKPANPTNQTVASFSFTGEAGATFLCKLDGAATFTACISPSSYPGLGAGLHTFQVEAKDAAGNIGAPTAYTWTIDLTPPAAPAITSHPASLVSSHNASFAFNELSEPTVSFLCKLDTGSYAACSSPKTYGSLVDGSHAFSVEAVDTAGNTSNASTFTWTVDTTPPPAPVFTQTPPDPSSTATSTFKWTESEAGVTFLCETENGSFSSTVPSLGGSPQPCVSPLTYNVQTTSNGQHQFGVEAVDAAGNTSQAIFYSWKVAAGSIQNFTIDGNAVGLLYPGGTARTISVTLHNPNSIPIFVTAVTAALRSADFPTGCTASAFTVTQAVIPAAGVQVAANGQVTLPAQSATAPTVQMADSGNQNLCKNISFHFDYTGSAHS